MKSTLDPNLQAGDMFMRVDFKGNEISGPYEALYREDFKNGNSHIVARRDHWCTDRDLEAFILHPTKGGQDYWQHFGDGTARRDPQAVLVFVIHRLSLPAITQAMEAYAIELTRHHDQRWVSRMLVEASKDDTHKWWGCCWTGFIVPYDKVDDFYNTLPTVPGVVQVTLSAGMDAKMGYFKWREEIL